MENKSDLEPARRETSPASGYFKGADEQKEGTQMNGGAMTDAEKIKFLEDALYAAHEYLMDRAANLDGYVLNLDTQIIAPALEKVHSIEWKAALTR